MDGGLVGFQGGGIGEVFVAFGAGKAPPTMNRLHMELQRVNVGETAVANPTHEFLRMGGGEWGRVEDESKRKL